MRYWYALIEPANFSNLDQNHYDALIYEHVRQLTSIFYQPITTIYLMGYTS